jgi:hypothetical protein
MLTALGPYAATDVETRGVVWSDRSTAREFADNSVYFASPHRRDSGRVFAASALDHGYRCREHDEHYGSDSQELLRSEK